MGTVTRVDVDDMGQVFWLITSVESEIADVVVFGKDLQRAGITEGIQVGDFVSYLKVSYLTVFGQKLKRATDLTVFQPLTQAPRRLLGRTAWNRFHPVCGEAIHGETIRNQGRLTCAYLARCLLSNAFCNHDEPHHHPEAITAMMSIDVSLSVVLVLIHPQHIQGEGPAMAPWPLRSTRSAPAAMAGFPLLHRRGTIARPIHPAGVASRLLLSRRLKTPRPQRIA